MNRIHALLEPIDGCTHIIEIGHRSWLNDDGKGGVKGRIIVEVQGGRLDDEGNFTATYPSGRPTSPEERFINNWPDYERFQAAFEADPQQPQRSLEHRAHVCRLMYIELVRLGQWVPETPLFEEPALPDVPRSSELSKEETNASSDAEQARL